MAGQLPLGLIGPKTSEPLAPGAVLLRALARAGEAELLEGVAAVVARAPFRHMSTPGGFRMSAAMTSCGALGWVSDSEGYRYARVDPESGLPWPEMPPAFRQLALRAASLGGFPAFEPDSCLVNRYQPGAGMTLHQDRNERDFDQPIVSVSLGIPAIFLFGGELRSDRPRRVRLEHGDVVVWGGPARMRFHGVLPIAEAHHPLVGGHRLNLTFRKAG